MVKDFHVVEALKNVEKSRVECRARLKYLRDSEKRLENYFKDLRKALLFYGDTDLPLKHIEVVSCRERVLDCAATIVAHAGFLKGYCDDLARVLRAKSERKDVL